MAKNQSTNHSKSSPGKAAPRQSTGYTLQKAKPHYYVHNAFVTYYVLAMLSVFTLFLTHKFANARHDKFYFYLVLSGLLVLGAAIAYPVAYFSYRNSKKPLPPFFKPITVADGAFLAFLILAAISAFASKYFPETLIAEVGRNNGLVLLLMYTAVFFIVTRLYIHGNYVLVVYLISACAVGLLTVLNFFYIDILGIYKGYKESVINDFGATIGNKNLIASYMALFLPIAVMTLVVSEKRFLRIIAGISVAIAYAGALCANSSSIFLGLMVAIPVMAIFSARKYEFITRFMLAMTIMFAGGKLLMLFSAIMGNHQKGFEFIQEFLIYHPLGFVPIAVFGAITLALYLLRKKAEPHYPAKVITIIFIVLTVLLIVGSLGAILYFSLVDTKTKLGSFDRLLRFNDRWGTHRGFMWIRATREFGKYDFFHVLFGSGPDTAYYVMEPHFKDLLKFGDSSTDCVHNEFLNYLITQGVLGLAAYLTLLGSVCVRAIRRARVNPTALIFISAVICYAAQSLVNLYQPITTPLFFLFLTLAEALNRQTPLPKKEPAAA